MKKKSYPVTVTVVGKPSKEALFRVYERLLKSGYALPSGEKESMASEKETKQATDGNTED